MESKSYNLLDQQKAIREIISNEADPAFFILNNSDRPNAQNRATQEAAPVLFTVMVDGQSRIVRVPPSWVPVDAAMTAPKSDIAKSGEFNRALAAGMIIVLAGDVARNIIDADAQSRSEYSRVMAIAQNINGGDNGYNAFDGKEAEPEDDPWANVSPAVKTNVEEMVNDNMSEGEFLSFLRRSARSISKLDKSYIKDKLPLFELPNF